MWAERRCQSDRSELAEQLAERDVKEITGSVTNTLYDAQLISCAYRALDTLWASKCFVFTGHEPDFQRAVSFPNPPI